MKAMGLCGFGRCIILFVVLKNVLKIEISASCHSDSGLEKSKGSPKSDICPFDTYYGMIQPLDESLLSRWNKFAYYLSEKIELFDINYNKTLSKVIYFATFH